MAISLGTETRAGVFGYGAEGRASVAWLLRRRCLAVRVIAAARPADLPDGVPWIDERDSAALDGLDLVLKSPGIKPSHPLLLAAASRGLPVTSATAIFVALARRERLAVVGVTGSKGKSTTASLIHRTLEAAGVPSVLVGNIGRPALDVLEDAVSVRPVVVYEMSSYQTHDLTLGPSVAVITRLFPEHLDWHGDAGAYYASKLRIAATQRPDDVTVWNAGDLELARRFPFGPARHVAYGGSSGFRFEGGAFRRGDEVLFSDVRMLLRGPHNRANACAALAAASLFGASPAHLEEVLADFRGLPHRLEDLGLHGGIRWINDSISTAPEAAVAALEAFGGEVATYIGGGTDRGFDFAPLAEALLARAIPNVVLVPETGSRIKEAVLARDPSAASRLHAARDLADAVALARRLTPQGRTVLFSPASPSYGPFANFEERGDRLRAYVQEAS
ncbi:MAG TPA: UDP-N-acetylmuramoyl-L-alanine--D-glutamate ligase [Candidatus Polarisedimenticolaceae bacterium]|nr:UDP-N-acetylmuramoyl-L-alanine--D-glutamate ligase [Candidatus Polarisedimenticolaceae bacterium]